jgi:hypothetical protein
MSTEQKKEQPSEAAQRLSHGWEQFKQGKIISYRVMALILLIATGIGVYIYISVEGKKGDSKRWTALEDANSAEELEKFAKANPNTFPGKMAELYHARLLLGPEGIEALSTRDESRRRKAVENIEKARDMLQRLSDELKDYPAFRAECYLGCARAEEALVGITKDGKIDEFRGSIDKLIDWLNKLAEAAPETPWGKDAKEQVAALKDPAKRDELTRTQVGLYKIEALPPTSPFSPGGAPPIGPIPNIPGGGGPGPIPPTGPAPAPTTPAAGPTPPAGPPPMPPAGPAPAPPTTTPKAPAGPPPTPAAPPTPPPEPPKK